MKVYDVLKEYKSLLDEGVISQEQFDKKKRDILGISVETAHSDNFEELKIYKRLLDEGVITEVEFEKKKRDILGMPDKEEQQRKVEQDIKAEEERQKKIEEEKQLIAEHQRKLEEDKIAEREHQRKVEEAKLAEQEHQRKVAEGKRAEAARKKQEKEIKKAERKVANRKRMKIVIIVITVIVVLIGGFFVFNTLRYSGRIDTTNYNVTYEWPSTGLALDIPIPEVETGEVNSDYDTFFGIHIYNVSTEAFDEYVTACKNAGYTVVVEETDTRYLAYNQDNTRYLEVKYGWSSDDSMYITVEAPEDWEEIYWPKSKIANTLPVPSKLYGKISTDESDSLDIYIANVSQVEFDAYIDACIESGYDVDYSRYEDSFSAEDANGNELDIYYESFNVMNIDADAK